MERKAYSLYGRKKRRSACSYSSWREGRSRTGTKGVIPDEWYWSYSCHIRASSFIYRSRVVSVIYTDQRLLSGGRNCWNSVFASIYLYGRNDRFGCAGNGYVSVPCWCRYVWTSLRWDDGSGSCSCYRASMETSLYLRRRFLALFWSSWSHTVSSAIVSGIACSGIVGRDQYSSGTSAGYTFLLL